MVMAVKPNQPPVAVIPAVYTITMPTSAVALDCSKSYDPDGTIAACSFKMVSGPNVPVLSGGAVSGLVAGTYNFVLTVTDNSGATSTANTSIVVNLPPKTIVAQKTISITITYWSDGTITYQ